MCNLSLTYWLNQGLSNKVSRYLWKRLCATSVQEAVRPLDRKHNAPFHVCTCNNGVSPVCCCVVCGTRVAVTLDVRSSTAPWGTTCSVFSQRESVPGTQFRESLKCQTATRATDSENFQFPELSFRFQNYINGKRICPCVSRFCGRFSTSCA